MKQYVFEITLSERDLEGDEFWEDVIKEDPTGIAPIKEHLSNILNDHMFGGMLNKEKLNEIVQLKSFKS